MKCPPSRIRHVDWGATLGGRISTKFCAISGRAPSQAAGTTLCELCMARLGLCERPSTEHEPDELPMWSATERGEQGRQNAAQKPWVAGMQEWNLPIYRQRSTPYEVRSMRLTAKACLCCSFAFPGFWPLFVRFPVVFSAASLATGRLHVSVSPAARPRAGFTDRGRFHAIIAFFFVCWPGQTTPSNLRAWIPYIGMHCFNIRCTNTAATGTRRADRRPLLPVSVWLPRLVKEGEKRAQI